MTSKLSLDWGTRRTDIAYAWVGDQSDVMAEAPVMVSLHEGLGSVEMWRDFPTPYAGS